MRNVQEQTLKALNNKGSAIFEEHEKTGIMQIGKKFNTLSISQYHHYIANYKKYTDFNRLGLYRSILENEKLSTEERIALRDHANETFGKYYHFLQVKDPGTYFGLCTIGLKMTSADEEQVWRNIKEAQEQILRSKRIKHRNFGVHSKHLCYYDDCPKHNVMTQYHSDSYVPEIHLSTDKSSFFKSEKAKERVKNRKNQYRIVAEEYYLDD